MGRIIVLALLAATLASCSGYGGGGSPQGSSYPLPAAPTAKPVSSPLPSGNPDVDNYGY